MDQLPRPESFDNPGQEMTASSPGSCPLTPPIAVWHFANLDEESADPATTLFERLLAQLVATYTNRGDIVATVLHDPRVAEIATRSRRRYRFIEGAVSGEGTGSSPALAIVTRPDASAVPLPAATTGVLRSLHHAAVAVVISGPHVGDPSLETPTRVTADAWVADLTIVATPSAQHADQFSYYTRDCRWTIDELRSTWIWYEAAISVDRADRGGCGLR